MEFWKKQIDPQSPAVWHQTTECFDLKLREFRLFHFLKIKLDKTKKQTQKTNSYLQKIFASLISNVQMIWVQTGKRHWTHKSLFFAFQNQKSHSNLKKQNDPQSPAVWHQTTNLLISNYEDFEVFHFLQIKLDKTKKQKQKTNSYFAEISTSLISNVQMIWVQTDGDTWKQEFLLCISKSKISFDFGRNKMIPNLPQFDIKRQTVLISNCGKNFGHFVSTKSNSIEQKTNTKNKLLFAANLRQFDFKCPNDLSPNWRWFTVYKSLFFAFQNQKISFEFGKNKMTRNILAVWHQTTNCFDFKLRVNRTSISFPPNQTRPNKTNTKNKLLFAEFFASLISNVQMIWVKTGEHFLETKSLFFAFQNQNENVSQKHISFLTNFGTFSS